MVVVRMGKSRTVVVVMGEVTPRASSAWGKLRDGRRRDGEVQKKKGKMAERNKSMEDAHRFGFSSMWRWGLLGAITGASP